MVRRGGRAALKQARSVIDVTMLPSLGRRLPPVEPLDESQIHRIDEASLDILEQVGCVFRDPEAIADWRAAGADIREGERVHPDRELIRSLLSSVPESFTYHIRNPVGRLPFGREHSIFVPMAGAPFIRDLEDVRRASRLEDLHTFHKLSQMLPALHSTSHHIVEPMDIPVAHRHLDITWSSLVHADKTLMGMTSSGRNAEDVLAMCEIVFGKETMEQYPVVTGNCNANSPLLWDETMLAAMRAFCKRGQPVLCSPFALSGANTPASVAASVAQLNAEALAGLAYTQLVRRGTPAIYGHYLSSVSMKSGSPMQGTPELSLMNYMIGQMARFYQVPWRSSSLIGGAKLFDAQAGYESATTLMAVLHAGANYLWHSAGWNEAGMHCSVAKFIVDAEQCAMAYRLGRGVDFDHFEEALASIADVGPGGHFLGHPFTLQHFQEAFFIPEQFDNNSFEQWQVEGSHDTTARAIARARQLLAQYQAPAMDVEVREALDAFVARRKEEIPAVDELNTLY